LDNDVERHGAIAAKIDQVGDNDLVPGARNGQELRQPLDHAQNDRLQGTPQIHLSPKCDATRGRPLVLIDTIDTARGACFLQRKDHQSQLKRPAA